MRYSLFDFQKNAVNELLKKISSMQKTYDMDGSLSAVSLTAPTGAGKTVISAAVAEGLFYGNDVFPGDDKAIILWLSDSPSLNSQTMKRFDAATDLLNGITIMEAIGPTFAQNHHKLERGHVYFLNRQLLSSKATLAKDSEGNRTFYNILSETIEDTDIHLYLFIDEAHRGLGKEETSDKAKQTIYAKLIDGQPGINPPMPIVIGISATPERFANAMNGRKNRDVKAPVNVPVSEVRKSGLIKESIELRTPKKSADIKHQDLTYSCIRLANSSKTWKKYCVANDIPVVSPLMVVQVEDKVTDETLDSICSQIRRTLPWLESDCFANVFGEQKDIITNNAKIPYYEPDSISDRTEVKVLFAKDAISTGWDCPRAEVIYSRRKRSDPTYIAQLIGRMIRTPLARKITTYEELNTVSCYLPEYDAVTVDAVIEKLKEDNIAISPNKLLKNPIHVTWFGETKKSVEKKLASVQSLQTTNDAVEESQNKDIEIIPASIDDEFGYNIHADETSILDTEEIVVNETEDELKDVLERIPKVDPGLIKTAFEQIITRQIWTGTSNIFLDLWDCRDIITFDIEPGSNIEDEIQEEFYNNIEAEIIKHRAEYKRAWNDIRSTQIAVKRVDPLTGEVFEDREELALNDSDRLSSYYYKVVRTFSNASDIIKYYINRRMKFSSEDESEAISRIAAAGETFEIVRAMESWAEEKIRDLLDTYSSYREHVSEVNRERWDQIEGNTKPYIERNLNINASIQMHNRDYDKYPKHIISDDNGWAYINLNELEKKVVSTELSKPFNVAWYRNSPRNLNASFSIPYMLNGEWKPAYPDFIFFEKAASGTIKPAIVDPHGDWLGDSISKLKGYIAYLKDHPDMFTRFLAVADEGHGTYRYLDLKIKAVQDAIDSFTGTSAKELFTGTLSRNYKIIDNN